jgi:hypothetical protein
LLDTGLHAGLVRNNLFPESTVYDILSE